MVGTIGNLCQCGETDLSAENPLALSNLLECQGSVLCFKKYFLLLQPKGATLYLYTAIGEALYHSR